MSILTEHPSVLFIVAVVAVAAVFAIKGIGRVIMSVAGALLAVAIVAWAWNTYDGDIPAMLDALTGLLESIARQATSLIFDVLGENPNADPADTVNELIR